VRQSEERSAVLVIRAWQESDGPTGPGRVRARLTQTPDATLPGWEQAVAEGEEDILAVVRDWLRALSTPAR
jgi:hypothetical protein